MWVFVFVIFNSKPNFEMSLSSYFIIRCCTGVVQGFSIELLLSSFLFSRTTLNEAALVSAWSSLAAVKYQIIVTLTVLVNPVKEEKQLVGASWWERCGFARFSLLLI